MDYATALDIIEEIQYEQGEGLLETLMYMDGNLDQFSDRQVAAFRVAMAGFRQLIVG